MGAYTRLLPPVVIQRILLELSLQQITPISSLVSPRFASSMQKLLHHVRVFASEVTHSILKHHSFYFILASWMKYQESRSLSTWINAIEHSQVALSSNISRHLIVALSSDDCLLPPIKIQLWRCVLNGMIFRISGLPKIYSICTGPQVG